MITQKKIDVVKAEIERLLERLKDYEAIEHGCGPKQTGAIGRASMDLTRVLADLRRS
jgi:hypothetical protein